MIIVFDVTSKDSFSKIKDWVQSINDKAHKNVKFILIGNKIDGKREVSKEDGLNLAKKYGVNYYDVSTKSNTGINEAIKDLTSQILNSNNSNNSNNERKLNNVLVEDKQCCSIF